MKPGVVLVLLEQWTLVDGRDMAALVQMAVDAETAGVETVMLSDHVLLTPKAGAEGRMANPRDYAAPGNQDPFTPWPDSVVLASAIAARTSTIRIALSALPRAGRAREDDEVRIDVVLARVLADPADRILDVDQVVRKRGAGAEAVVRREADPALAGQVGADATGHQQPMLGGMARADHGHGLTAGQQGPETAATVPVKPQRRARKLLQSDRPATVAR